MKISGPKKDRAKTGQPKPWYLVYHAPKLGSDGSVILGANGRPVLQRNRPYYESCAQAKADMARIRDQYGAAGSSELVLGRESVVEFEQAKRIAGKVSLVDVANFWILHHPVETKKKLGELLPEFLKTVGEDHGEERHWKDLRSRCGAFVSAGFGERYVGTVTRQEILAYVRGLPVAPRTKRNHKTSICEYFNWLVDQGHVSANPAAGIKKRMLPKETKKEIRFLSLPEVERYLRAAERYAPNLVAHEVVQLIAGVRADEEMAAFRAEYVLPQTREVVIPAAIAKTGVREVIDGLESNFWDWWDAYGKKQGLLRPRNFERSWARLRILASVEDQKAADELARLPVKTLLKRPESKLVLDNWPWNARRRTFCTYHVAKHQDAARTALIMRHRGSSYVLHASYRGLGVTKAQGQAYFKLMPKPVAAPILPVHHRPSGIVKLLAGKLKGRDREDRSTTVGYARRSTNPT